MLQPRAVIAVRVDNPACFRHAELAGASYVLPAHVQEAHNVDAETALLDATLSVTAADDRRRRQLGTMASVISQTRYTLHPHSTLHYNHLHSASTLENTLYTLLYLIVFDISRFAPLQQPLYHSALHTLSYSSLHYLPALYTLRRTTQLQPYLCHMMYGHLPVLRASKFSWQAACIKCSDVH